MGIAPTRCFRISRIRAENRKIPEVRLFFVRSIDILRHLD